MAEKNSSSIKSNHNRGQSIGQGWEEAKGEFYQEAFRTASSSGEPDSNKLELTAWEAILPSQRTKIIGSCICLFSFKTDNYVGVITNRYKNLG